MCCCRTATRPARGRYPVLLLLHGCCDDYRSWVDKGRAEQLSAGYPLIVVMPDGGSAGWYSDPVNTGAGPRVRDLRLRRAAAVGGRDVPQRPPARRRGAEHGRLRSAEVRGPPPGHLPGGGELQRRDGRARRSPQNGYANLIPDAVWGPRATELARWREHNPLDLAANLRGLKLLELRTGNGLAGPARHPHGPRQPREPRSGARTPPCTRSSTSSGSPHVYDDYGPGVHDWPYWARGLAADVAQPDARCSRPRAPGTVGGDVPVVLSLQLGAAASFGTFVPATARTYTATTTATVDLDRGRRDAVRRRPRPPDQRRVLTRPTRAGQRHHPPGALKTWSGPTTAEPVTLAFEQAIGAQRGPAHGHLRHDADLHALDARRRN